MVAVNWMHLARAVDFWTAQGFEQIDVPWRVSPEAARMTHPHFIESEGLALVGSAEQSFLHLDLHQGVRNRDLLAVSPCFRTEAEYTETHRAEFMKVELYRSGDVSENDLERLVSGSERLFRSLAPKSKLERIKTSEGYDLLLNDIEVGSYGIRNKSEIMWTYGTAIAEPRFSVAMALSSH